MDYAHAVTLSLAMLSMVFLFLTLLVSDQGPVLVFFLVITALIAFAGAMGVGVDDGPPPVPCTVPVGSIVQWRTDVGGKYDIRYANFPTTQPGTFCAVESVAAYNIGIGNPSPFNLGGILVQP